MITTINDDDDKCHENSFLGISVTKIINEYTPKTFETFRAVSVARYLSWWEASDKRPNLIGMCENMARLVSHSGRIKSDDVQLKGLIPSQRSCSECDLCALEDLHHIVMQRPSTELTRARMFDSLMQIYNRIDDICKDSPGEVFNWLIGKENPTINRSLMFDFWETSGKHICEMYYQTCRNTTGIG